MAEQAATVSKGTREGFVEVSFPTKPDEAVRKELGLAGFRFNGKKSVWWGRVEALPEKYKGLMDGKPATEDGVNARITGLVDALEAMKRPVTPETDDNDDTSCEREGNNMRLQTVPAPAVVTPQLPPPLPAAAYVAPKPHNAQREAVRKWARKRLQDRPIPGKQYALTGKTGAKCISNGNTWAESEVHPNATPHLTMTPKELAKIEGATPELIAAHLKGQVDAAIAASAATATPRLVDFQPLDGYEWKGNAFPPSSGWWSDGTLMLRHGFVDDKIEWQDVGKYKTPVADKIWKSLVARITDGRWGTREVVGVKMYQHPEQDAESDSTKYVYLMPKDGKEPLVIMRQTWSFVKAHLEQDCDRVCIAGPKDPAIIYNVDDDPVAVVMPVHPDARECSLKLYYAAIDADRPLLQDVPPADSALRTQDSGLRVVAPHPPVPSNPKILQLLPTPPPPVVPGGDLALAKAEANMAEIDAMLAELGAPH